MVAMRNWGQGKCCRPGNPIRGQLTYRKLPAHPALSSPQQSVSLRRPWGPHIWEALRPRAGPSCRAWSQRGFSRTWTPIRGEAGRAAVADKPESGSHSSLDPRSVTHTRCARQSQLVLGGKQGDRAGGASSGGHKLGRGTCSLVPE